MTVASIFHFEFWFLWGIGLGAFLGAFWRALWVLRACLGVLWGSFGGSLGDFLGSLDVLLVAVGCLGDLLEGPGVPGTSLGASGLISGIFREIPGGLLGSFGMFRVTFGGLWTSFWLLWGALMVIWGSSG